MPVPLLQVVVKLYLVGHRVCADEEGDWDTGFFSHGTEIDVVVLVAVVKGQNHRRAIHLIVIQHFDCFAKTDNPVVFL